MMLNRKPGQSIQIGDDIHVYIFEVRGNQVRIGISTPTGVKILVEEVHDGTSTSHVTTRPR